VSALVTFELFVRPALRRMQGMAALFRRPVPAVLDQDISIGAPLTHFLRAIATPRDNVLHVRLTGPQGSGLLSSLVLANALLVVPPDRPSTRAGESLSALLLGEDAGHATTLGL
jgi:molybdopterin molybdotransferase